MSKLTNEKIKRLVLEELENNLKQKNIFVLVGPPSVGKSYWIKQTFGEEKPYIISRDDIAEQVASTYGWNYDDMFVAPPPDSQIGDSDEKYGNVVKSPPWMT